MDNTQTIDVIEINTKSKEKVKSKKLYFAVKRLFDILISLIGMVFIIPIALIVKISYIITGDFHSIFYRQKRIGKNGKKIYIFKFRTMVYNADEELKKLLKIKKYKEQWKNNQKLDDDPRITKAGKLLRKLSLDEIPQFINVFIGDMSLIGPRPLVDGEIEEHDGNHEIYESVKPGITGWWAANGRSATNYEKRLELEYYYAKNCSISLDIKCIFRTIKALITRHGAK